MSRTLLRLLLVVGCLGSSVVTRAADEAIDFERDIRPIFAARCVSCHGPERSQGGLRLDLSRHHEKLTFKFQGRNFRLTDVAGKPALKLMT